MQNPLHTSVRLCSKLKVFGTIRVHVSCMAIACIYRPYIGLYTNAHADAHMHAYICSCRKYKNLRQDIDLRVEI